MNDDKVLWYYDASKNPDGGFLPGVPLRDLTEAEFLAMPKWLQLSIEVMAMYRKTAPPKAAPKAEKD
jgi:hypothetical protein